MYEIWLPGTVAQLHGPGIYYTDHRASDQLTVLSRAVSEAGRTSLLPIAHMRHKLAGSAELPQRAGKACIDDATQSAAIDCFTAV